MGFQLSNYQLMTESIVKLHVWRMMNGCVMWCSSRYISRWFVFYVKIATWLILPVVIRSSQRLSHACLSINLLLWNCERLIISVIVYLIVPYYLDNRSNSRANTCANSRLSQGGKDVFIRSNQPGSPESLVSHNNWANRMALCRRWFIQVSALSAFDGRVLAYHGVNG